MRQFEAVVESSGSDLFQALLRPNVKDFYVRKNVEEYYFPNELNYMKGLNLEQKKIMSACASMATTNSRTPQAAIIQGPPGTGKSTTIAAMIMQIIFRSRYYYPGAPPPRILITAPSNAAVDELVRRFHEKKILIAFFPQSF